MPAFTVGANSVTDAGARLGGISADVLTPLGRAWPRRRLLRRGG